MNRLYVVGLIKKAIQEWYLKLDILSNDFAWKKYDRGSKNILRKCLVFTKK